MRTKTLDQMVTMLRAECGDSTNSSMGINHVEGLYQLLRRTQETLYDDYDWAQFIIDDDEAVPANERFFTFNDAIDYERIFGAWVKDSDDWVPLCYGINPEDYNTSDSENGETETVPTKWQKLADNQFEIWPMPSDPTTIRFRAIKKLPDMPSGTSPGTLDANLIVLFAAAERLASDKDQSAQIKLQRANARLVALRGNGSKVKIWSMNNQRPNHKALPKDWTVRVPR